MTSMHFLITHTATHIVTIVLIGLMLLTKKEKNKQFTYGIWFLIIVNLYIIFQSTINISEFSKTLISTIKIFLEVTGVLFILNFMEKNEK